MRKHGWLARAGLALSASAAQVLLSAAPSSAATTWWVDGADQACSDTAGGSPSSPFCTLTAAAKVAGAGDTVMARPATYREQVTVTTSGVSGLPVTFRAAGAGTRVVGTMDLSDDGGWQPTTSTAWSRPYAPPSAPRQVFVDGRRLTLAAGADRTTPGSFYYDAVAKVLHVDVGGANPGAGRLVEAGARTYGFNVSGRSHVVVDGFEVEGQNNHGVRVHASSDVTVAGVRATADGVNGILVDSATGPVTVMGCEVSDAGSVGIRVFRSSGALVIENRSHHNAFHGFALAAASGNALVRNQSHGNRVVNGASTATGIDINRNVDGSHANVLRGNVVWDNQDSGIQVYNGSDGNVLVRNVSHSNGDHGFDTLASTGTRYVSNTSSGNRNDGFSVEGGSTSTSLANNISADNGLSTGKHDLYVDEESVAGFTADHDLLWRATGSTVSYGGAVYADLAAFRSATGHEVHGVGADPAFESASTDDLRLTERSPALDAADASAPSFDAADAFGSPPADHPLVTDTGSGNPGYADIGAIEYAGPVAVLAVSPPSGQAPLRVTLDAGLSTVLDGSTPASYRFDCGDGTAPVTQAEPVTHCSYGEDGTYGASVAVMSTRGQVSEALTVVTVTPNTAPTASLSVSPGAGKAPLRVHADASGSTDTDGTGIASYRFHCGNGTSVGPQSSPFASCSYPAEGNHVLTVTVTDAGGLTGTASRTVRVKRK